MGVVSRSILTKIFILLTFLTLEITFFAILIKNEGSIRKY